MTDRIAMLDHEITAQLEACHTSGYCWALACCDRDAAEAEDVLQTVYLKILEGKARFRGESSFRTWLFSLVRITAADRRRRRVVRELFALRLAERGERNAPAEEDPDETVRRAETRRVFLRALGRLARRQREVLELVFYHEMSVEEAASVMRVTTGAARQHYERGKRRLRQVLEESEVSYVAEWRGREYPESYRSLHADESAHTPSFDRVMAAAHARRSTRPTSWAVRGFALASVAILACAAALAFVGPTGRHATSPAASDGANRASETRPVSTAPPETAVTPGDEAKTEPVAAEPASKRPGAKPTRAARRPRAEPGDACATCAEAPTDPNDPCATC